MRISKQGLGFIEEQEGKEKTVYLDSAGLPTIGIGHLLTKEELRSGKIQIGDCFVKYRDGLSDAEIYELLDQDADKAEAAVNAAGVDFEQHEFDALTSFALNVGSGAFLGSTLLKRIKAGASRDEIETQFRRWKYSGGRVVQGLINRRNHEIGLYFDRKY